MPKIRNWAATGPFVTETRGSAKSARKDPRRDRASARETPTVRAQTSLATAPPCRAISPQSSNLAPHWPRFAESWIKSTERSAPRRFRRSCGRFTTTLAASCGPSRGRTHRQLEPIMRLVGGYAGRILQGEASRTSGSAIDQDRADPQSQYRKGVGACGPNHAAGPRRRRSLNNGAVRCGARVRKWTRGRSADPIRLQQIQILSHTLPGSNCCTSIVER